MDPYGTIWSLHIIWEVPDFSPTTTVPALAQTGNITPVLLVDATEKKNMIFRSLTYFWCLT